jgi:hypothetical protein
MAKTTAEPIRKRPTPPPELVADAAGDGPLPRNLPAPGAIQPGDPPAEPHSDDFVWMASHSVEEWRLMTAYLYRQFPITNKRGDVVYLNVYGQAFDQADVMKDFGSGDYRCDVVRDSSNGNKRERVRRFYFSILNAEHPPKIPISEWVDDPRNEKWAWAKATIVNGITAGKGGGDGNQMDMLRTVLEYLEKNKPNVSKEDQANLASQVIKMMQEQAKQMMELTDPAKQLATLNTLIEAISPKKPAGEDPLLKLLIDDRAATRQEMRELRAEMANRPPQKGPLETLIEAGPLIEQFRQTFAPGGKQGFDWEGVITTSIAEIGKVALPIAQRIMNGPPTPATPHWQQNQPHQLEPPRTAPPPGAAPGSAPPPAANGAPPAGTETPGRIALNEQETQFLESMLPKYNAVIGSSAMFMVDAFTAGNLGYDFRDWFLSRKGMDWWGSLKKDMGVRGMLIAMRYDVGLWNAMADANVADPTARARTFFEEFFTEQGNEKLPESEFSDDDEDDDENKGETTNE